MFDREVAVGEHVEEQPCEPPHFPDHLRGDDGLPCPRTSLRSDNADAAILVQCALHEDLQHYGLILEPLLSRYSTDDEREALALRVVNTLTDADVSAARLAAFDRAMRERSSKS